MSILLTEEQQLIGQSARDFAKEYLEPMVLEMDRTGQYPAAVVKQLAAQDFLGLFLAGEYGGAEAGYVSLVEVVENLSRVSAAVASIMVNHALAAYAIQRWGSPEQKKTCLPKLAAGEVLGAFAVFEHGPTPGVGAGALMATKLPEGWALKGTKAFVRNAGAADVYLVFGIIRPEPDNTRLTCFIVDAGTSGLAVGPRLDTMGLKACPVAHLTFKSVAVAEAGVMGSEHNASGMASQILSAGAVAEGAQTVGIARAAAEHAADYAKHRVQFRHPIARLQAIQTLLAEIVSDSHVAWLGVQHAARLIEDNAPFEPEAAMVKLFLGRFGSKMLVDAIQIEGGMGICEVVPKHISGALPLARMFRDIAGTTLLDAPDDFPEKIIAAGIA